MVTFNARAMISADPVVVCTVASEPSSVLAFVFACVMPRLELVVAIAVSLDRVPAVPVGIALVSAVIERAL
jgi:hypothetical protein